MEPSLIQPRHCITCRHYTYQECYVAKVWEMHPHCARWHPCFPGATLCTDYEREPGSDDAIPVSLAAASYSMPKTLKYSNTENRPKVANEWQAGTRKGPPSLQPIDLMARGKI